MHLKQVQDIKKKQYEFFKTGATLPWEFRARQLHNLKKMLDTYRVKILEALEQDLAKGEFEALSSEFMPVLNDIKCALKHGKKWIKPKKVAREFTTLDGYGTIVQKPFGVTLIMAPWNYPVQLSLLPLVGAIAAGNCTILKISELTPHVESVLEQAVREYFDPAYITVVKGDISINKALLELDFDKIFFTGSPQVGRIVMEKAAKHLTPVTLELGGKSPCVFDEMPAGDLEKAVKRMLWGKFINGGQTCIAPDYVLVPEAQKNEFFDTVSRVLEEYKVERRYQRVINGHHYKRLKAYLKDGAIITGGGSDDENLLLELTLLEPSSLGVSVMTDEIFGPILPVISYAGKQDALEKIRQICEYPLAFYVFSKDEIFIRTMLENVSFGGAGVNDTISQILVHGLPFGGVRTSGMGSYHGKFSFEAFSRSAGVFRKGFGLELPFRYPPYKKGIKTLRAIVKSKFR